MWGVLRLLHLRTSLKNSERSGDGKMKSKQFKAIGQSGYRCGCRLCVAEFKKEKATVHRLVRHRIKQADTKTLNTYLEKGEY